MKKSWIGLLDCNNFFVSCERLFRPDLINQPVVVLSSNDGCVVARSQEVKDMGIPMGVPYFKIKDILEEAKVEVFSGNHTLYRDISRRVFTTMAELTTDMQQYSVDEAFFYFSGTEEEVANFARLIKDTVEQVVGIPVSLGVATSKTLAKVANEQAKKSKETLVLTNDRWKVLRRDYPVGKVWGIGGQLSKRLSDEGIATVEDFLRLDKSVLKKLFGVVGERLQTELAGMPVEERRVAAKQSIMSSQSFNEATTDRSVLEEAMAYHIEQVTHELRQMGHKTKQLSVFFSPSRHGDFVLQGQSGEQVFSVPVNSTKALLDSAITLVRKLYVADVPYKRAGVRVSDLVPESVSQLDLFATGKVEELDTLQDTIDQLRRQYKTGRVHLGFIEGERKYNAKADVRSPAYTTDWGSLAMVKAK